MSLLGSGAVAIWHDIAGEGRAGFYAWHGCEHMPERVAIPGFLRGRRYSALHGTPEFFNLYETASPAVLTGPDYLALLNAPTPWTAATVGYFRGVARSLCVVESSFGAGQGGLIATFRYDISDDAESGHRARMSARLERLAQAPGVAGAHLLVADQEGSAIQTEEKRARGGATLIPRWIVLIEDWSDIGPFVEAARRFADDPAFGAAATAPTWAVYRLQNTRDARQSDDAREPTQ